MLQTEYPLLEAALARAHAVLVEGRLFVEDSGREAMVLSSDGTTSYHVNGQCTCPASVHRDGPCKHRLALRLYQRVCDRLLTPAATPPAVPNTPPIPADQVVLIQGKPFVRFAGLLEVAHSCGLQSLETTVAQCSPTLAVCQCTARFQDGRTFTDVGDATPDNVVKHLAPHFIRIAATRATARALRRALGIAACAVEELGDDATDNEAA